MTASALVIAICTSPASGAVPHTSLPADAAPVSYSGANRSARPRACPSAKRAVEFYSRRITYWRGKMGAETRSLFPRVALATPRACPRYLSHVLQRKAYQARRAYERWWEYHWHWQAWLPAKHRRVGACETGYGREPGDFTWDSGLYVSFAGIYRPGYDDDAQRVGNLGWDETKRKLGRLPTPREQMQAVDSHRAAHGGWSGWGCRGA